jgi:hypothetical protein
MYFYGSLFYCTRCKVGNRSCLQLEIALDGSASAGMYDNVLDSRRGGQVASWTGAPEFFSYLSSFGRQQGRPWEPRQMYRQGGGVPMSAREKNGGRHGPSTAFGDHDPALDHRKEGFNLRHSQSEADIK